MRRLNGVDALMLYLDGGSAYNHTLKISVLDPSTDPDGWSWPKARQMFEERAHLLPVFRLRYLPTPLGLHHPIWVEDPEFDLDAHVRRVVCPAPGGMAEFCALVEQIYAHPLDRDRPLWQTWVVEGLDGGRVALVTLLHHAYSDGVGAPARQVAERECGDIKHEGAHRAALPCRCAAGGVQWPAHRAAGRRA